MNYSEEALKMQNNFMSSLPKENLDTLEEAFAESMTSDAGEHALRKGDKARDFNLINAKGGKTRLSDLLTKGPVVINFYRGGWCPYCNIEFKALHSFLPQIKEMGATLIGISPELPDASMDTVEKHQLQFEVLSDVDNKLAREYGILFEVPTKMRALYKEWELDFSNVNGNDSWELPIPATYVINRDGVIAHAYINKNYTERMEPADIVKVLKTLTVSV